MTTTASKLFLGASVVALLSAWAYGWGTGGGLTGVMLFGLKGGVGELAGYTILVAVAGVLAALGTATSILRDADPEHQAAVARLEFAPAFTAPAGPSYWPAAGALAVVVAIVGLVASPVLFVIGALAMLLVSLEWMVSAWSERATGDPDVNRQIRNRLMYPLEVPIGGALAVVVVVTSLSRVFLALDQTGTAIIAVVIAALILGVGFMVAYRPHLPRDAVAALIVLGAAIAIAAGIASAAAGPREFEQHEDEGHEPAGETQEGTAEHGAATLELSELTL